MFEAQRAQQLKALAVTPQWQALVALAKEIQTEVQTGHATIDLGSTTAEQVGLDAVHRDGQVVGIKKLFQRINQEIENYQRTA
jgi:hypothetical protein